MSDNNNKKTYRLGKIKQLIDLNGDSINFDLTFKVIAKDPSIPFNVLVVDQNTLDNTPELQYKKVDNGSITGKITADKNMYQNYFLILKSEIPCDVDVELIKKNLPKTPIITPRKINKTATTENLIKKNWKIIAIAGIFIGISVILYFYCKNSKSTELSTAPILTDFKPKPNISLNLNPLQQIKPKLNIKPVSGFVKPSFIKNSSPSPLSSPESSYDGSTTTKPVKMTFNNNRGNSYVGGKLNFKADTARQCLIQKLKDLTG